MKQALFAFLWAGSLFAANEALDQKLIHETLERHLIQDYLLATCGGDALHERPVWIFNHFIYQQNEEGQWIQIGHKEGKTLHFDFEDPLMPKENRLSIGWK